MDKIPKTVIKLLEKIVKLEPQEFIGVCKILGVKIYEEVRPVEENGDEEQIDIVIRPAELLIPEVVEKLSSLNRTQRRNLDKLLTPAVKGR